MKCVNNSSPFYLSIVEFECDDFSSCKIKPQKFNVVHSTHRTIGKYVSSQMSNGKEEYKRTAEATLASWGHSLETF